MANLMDHPIIYYDSVSRFDLKRNHLWYQDLVVNLYKEDPFHHFWW